METRSENCCPFGHTSQGMRRSYLQRWSCAAFPHPVALDAQWDEVMCYVRADSKIRGAGGTCKLLSAASVSSAALSRWYLFLKMASMVHCTLLDTYTYGVGAPLARCNCKAFSLICAVSTAKWEWCNYRDSSEHTAKELLCWLLKVADDKPRGIGEWMVHRIALVRHGQSKFNLEKKFTGWTDINLTETGEKEAIQVVHATDDQ